MQIALPESLPPWGGGYVPVFVPFVRSGHLVYLSGRLAKKDAQPWSGKLGADITTVEGKQPARGIAIELLATLQAALGDLDKIKRIVQLLVLVNSAPDFTKPHVVADGASELFVVREHCRLPCPDLATSASYAAILRAVVRRSTSSAEVYA
jgi:enamine deaminase RidA (YjgF/YER057c/UK114 family)